MSRPRTPRRGALVAALWSLAAAVVPACSGSTSPDAAGGYRVVVEPPEVEVGTGSSLPLQAVVRDAKGEVVAAPQLFWASGDTSIASVTAGGVVTGRKVGVTRVVASVLGSDADVTVRVVAPAIASVAITPAPAAVVVGGTQQLTASVRDASGAERPEQTVSWLSQNEAVATVSPFTGLVTGRTAGTATIVATAAGRSGTVQVTVGTAPVASGPLTADFAVGCTNLICAFTDLSDGGGSPVKGWTWDFGDGQASPFRHSDNRYATTGTFTVRFSATTEGGTTASVAKLVAVRTQRGRTLVNRATGACLGVENGSADRGILIVMRACDGGPDQLFALAENGQPGPLQLADFIERYVQLEVERDGVISTWSWHGGYFQRWTHTPSAQLRNFQTGSCLSSASPGNVKYPVMAPCQDEPSQQWELRG